MVHGRHRFPCLAMRVLPGKRSKTRMVLTPDYPARPPVQPSLGSNPWIGVGAKRRDVTPQF
jgi:hypothetical protein